MLLPANEKKDEATADAEAAAEEPPTGGESPELAVRFGAPNAEKMDFLGARC